MQSSSENLRSLIREKGGLISLERFMQEALYHPIFGYYANRVRSIGAGGDFSTSATLHTALPRAIAAWATSHRREVTQRGSWHIIELGGGGGQMAEGVLRATGWYRRPGLHYHLVEVSGPLRTLQQGRLASYRRHVHWHVDIAGALDAAGGQALIFSNEFVDAFPCIQLVRGPGTAQTWSEIMVAWPEGSPHPIEHLVPWENPAKDRVEASVLATEYGRSANPGQRVEIHQSYRRWLIDWLPQWQAGRLLTVDYGDILPALYFRRPGGSLRAYAHHHRITGPGIYRHVGQQDLTADVNFTDLAAWGVASGLQTAGYCPQSEFLRRWLGKKRVEQAAIHDPALAFVLDEAGAGQAFKMLEQTRLAIR